jgi:predicted nucleic acid-binding protein
MASTMIKRAYLDTNVLIEHAWARQVGVPSPRKNIASELIEFGLDGRYKIYISTFCVMEMYEHFRDWYLMQKVIENGFGFREFRRERKRYKLSKEEAQVLDDLVEELRDDPDIYFVEFDKVPRHFFSRVRILQRNGIDSFDAFHILTALDIEATHFVTKDGEVRSRFDRATKREIESPPMEMTSIRGFLKGLN